LKKPEEHQGEMPDPSLFHINVSETESAFEKSAIEEVLGLPFTENNYVRLLASGEETFRTIFDTVNNAQDIICIEFYIFKDDSTGKRLADLLMKKARQGVKVYVLYDHFGSLTTSGNFWSEMREAGINLRASRPFKWSAPRRYVYRNHKKLLIIDGQKAFTGGFNIADEYGGYFRKGKLAWRDTGIYLEGPIALTLLDIFKKSWTAWKGKPILWDTQARPAEHGVPVIPIFTSSAKGRRKLRKLFFYSINNAKEKIFLTSAYFTPSKRIIRVLENAVKRGVNVKLLLPGKSDFPPVYYAGRHFYSKLSKAGIEIYNYQGRILHAKTAVFDRSWSIIGSANLDFQSLRRNDESNVGILNLNFGKQMTESFLKDLRQSVKVNTATWSNRPFHEKVLERVFSIFRKRL
jgi:cardiolipin synthase